MTTSTILLSHRIEASWVSGSQHTEDRNPARPDEVVALAPIGDRSLADRALAAAQNALPAWARLPAPARGEILHQAASLLAARAERIGAELTREEGKTIAEALGETRRAAAIFRYFAGRTLDPIGEVYASATFGTRITTMRQPVGVVAVITPWNFPIAIPAWKIAPALAYGNCVVFKPATPTPLLAYRLVEALVDAGLPSGVVNLVYAPGADVCDAWIREGGVDALSFTGSEAVGRALAARASEANIRVQLELGGKNAVIVAADADTARAADFIIRGGYAAAGQKCTATSRVIAIADAGEMIARALADRVGRLVAGDPLDGATSLPPLIDDAARRRVGAMVEDAVSEGAQILRGAPVPERGAFYPATLLSAVTPDMAIARDEVFGPVVSLLPAGDLDEAIAVHNAVSYGLSGSIFTRDLATADTFVHAAHAGVIHVNGETAGTEPHVPFGGMKRSSSWSREQGREAEHFYTQTKTIYWDGLPGVGLWG